MYFLSWVRSVLLVIAVLSLLAGCAERGPIPIDLAYQPPAEKATISHAIVIGVSPIRDIRGLSASLIGKRIVASGLEDDIVTRGTVADVVTENLKDAVRAHGMVVKDTSPWNMTSEGMPADGYNLVIGCEITSLWIDSVSIPFKTKLKTSVQLRVSIGDATEKKVIRVLNVSSKNEEDVLYAREKLSGALSEALSAALEQIFQDDILKKKIQ